jgi:hypothetical protein
MLSRSKYDCNWLHKAQPFWLANIFQPVKDLPTLYATQMLIIMSINVCHLFLFIATLIQSNALQFYFFKIHYNIILPSMLRSSKKSPSPRLLCHSPTSISLSLIHNICWRSNKIWWTIQIMKHSFYSFLQPPPSSADSFSKTCLEWSQPMFSSQWDGPSFRPIHKNRQTG